LAYIIYIELRDRRCHFGAGTSKPRGAGQGFGDSKLLPAHSGRRRATEPLQQTFRTSSSLEHILNGLASDNGDASTFNPLERQSLRRDGGCISDQTIPRNGAPGQRARGAKKDANAKMSYALQVRKQNALLNSSLPVESAGIGRIQSQIMSRKGIVSGLRQRRIRRALQQRQNLGDQLLSRSLQEEALPSNRVLEKYKRQLAKGYGQ